MEIEEVRGRKKLVIIITVLPGHNLQPTMTPRPAYPANKRVRRLRTGPHTQTNASSPGRAALLRCHRFTYTSFPPPSPFPSSKPRQEGNKIQRAPVSACLHALEGGLAVTHSSLTPLSQHSGGGARPGTRQHLDTGAPPAAAVLITGPCRQHAINLYHHARASLAELPRTQAAVGICSYSSNNLYSYPIYVCNICRFFTHLSTK